jgi:hypothetical protein
MEPDQTLQRKTDGISTIALRPAKCPSRALFFLSPGTYMQSRWAQNGRQEEEVGICSFYSILKRKEPLPEFALKPLQ